MLLQITNALQITCHKKYRVQRRGNNNPPIFLYQWIVGVLSKFKLTCMGTALYQN